MKKINFKLSLLALSFMLVSAVGNVSAQTTEQETTREKEASVEIKVTGMTCGGCASHVHQVLSETEGVIDNSVKYPGDIAIVKYDPKKISPKGIAESIEAHTTYTAEIVVKKDDGKSSLLETGKVRKPNRTASCCAKS